MTRSAKCYTTTVLGCPQCNLNWMNELLLLACIWRSLKHCIGKTNYKNL